MVTKAELYYCKPGQGWYRVQFMQGRRLRVVSVKASSEQEAIAGAKKEYNQRYHHSFRCLSKDPPTAAATTTTTQGE